jgi:sarcosine oxidase subunit beta
MSDILIIGGGISGTAAACELARAGHAVTLIEKHSLAAMGSGWSLAGVRQSGRDPAELPLALAAIALWPNLADDLGAPTDYRRHGNLRLARNPEEAAKIRTMVNEQAGRGLELSYLADNAAVRAVAPALSPEVLAASFCPSDGHADPLKTVQAFAAAARRAGATIREECAALALRVQHGRVVGVETADGFLAAGHVVLANGIHAPELLAPTGLKLPIRAALVSVMQTVPLPPMLAQVFGTAAADCAGRQQVDGRLRVTNSGDAWLGDAARWTPESILPTVHNLASIITRVGHILPAFREARIARFWGGLIDITPDALPVIDNPDAVAGLTVAAGFSGHGFALGPITGRLIADLATANRPRLDLSAFRLARFAGHPFGAPPSPTLHG